MVPKRKIKFIVEDTKKNCVCLGSGCGRCGKKINRLLKYSQANIPIDYWPRPFKDFLGDPRFKEKISEKINNIDEVYRQGESMAFIGNFGTGKTYAACCILKKAIVSDYTALYTNMADIVSGLVSKSSDNHQYLEILINTDFLVVDEFDNRWVFPSEKAEQLFGQTLEHILRSRFQNKMPTILCSNTKNIDNVLTSDFSDAFSSLRHQHLEVIRVAGKDFRKCQ
jgi:DNA replication protein DnaC